MRLDVDLLEFGSAGEIYPAEIGSLPDVEDAFFFDVGSGHGSVISPCPYGTSSIFGPQVDNTHG